MTPACARLGQGLLGVYSHSMVAGGLELTS